MSILENDSMTGSSTPWQQARLAALDLEGSGAQDRDNEAILEIAVVPLSEGQPDLPRAYSTLVNPQRPVPGRPWISPGLTMATLSAAPAIASIEPELARRLSGAIIVGHNVGVDWRLLRRRCPSIRPAGLLDTLRLARLARPGDERNSLSALLDRHELTGQVTGLAPGSRPHRALWDAAGTVVLLRKLITMKYPDGVSIQHLMSVAGTDVTGRGDGPAGAVIQGQLFG
jgi:DNA polymerase III epsilon subunit-like protein